MPSGAWDTHVHIFGPPEKYAHVAKPHYTLPDGTLAQYLRLMPHLGISRFVIVQPSYYGADNSCLLDTLAQVGDLARGVVMIEPDIANAELERLPDNIREIESKASYPVSVAPALKELARTADAAAKPVADGPFVVRRILQIDKPMAHGDWVWDDTDVPPGPVVITVDLKAEMLSVFRGGYEIGAAIAESGAFDALTDKIQIGRRLGNNAARHIAGEIQRCR